MGELWQPILTGERADAAVAAIRGIAADLAPLRDASVRVGDDDPGDDPRPAVDAVLAVFFKYLARAFGRAEDDEIADGFVEAACDGVGRIDLGPFLYGGLCGVAWALDEVDRLDGETGEDPNEEIDELMLEHLDVSPWRGNYDLVGGLVGFGLYFATRRHRPAARQGLELVVRRLSELAEESRSGVAWHTPHRLLPEWQREIAPGGYYNLGVAHGIPGIVAVLALAVAGGVAAGEAGRLFEGSVAWLLARRQDPERFGSYFPSWLLPDLEPKPGGMLGWCYGDPGASAALLWAARLVGDEKLEREAVAVLTHAARRSVHGGRVRDAGLCHGAAGLAHIFHRGFQATGREELGAAARHWFERTEELREPGQGYGGFRTARHSGDRDSPSPYRWVPDPSFLTGSAGIGLALLAAVAPVPPEWDKPLLISAPPAP